jgi:hypothetical protein
LDRILAKAAFFLSLSHWLKLVAIEQADKIPV